jgi:hypothetical protein
MANLLQGECIMSIVKKLCAALIAMGVALGMSTSAFSKTITIKLQSHLIPEDV